MPKILTNLIKNIRVASTRTRRHLTNPNRDYFLLNAFTRNDSNLPAALRGAGEAVTTVEVEDIENNFLTVELLSYNLPTFSVQITFSHKK